MANHAKPIERTKFYIRPSTLTDGSKVYAVVIEIDDKEVVLDCYDWTHASELCKTITETVTDFTVAAV